jgi:hypothetical protein
MQDQYVIPASGAKIGRQHIGMPQTSWPVEAKRGGFHIHIPSLQRGKAAGPVKKDFAPKIGGGRIHGSG